MQDYNTDTTDTATTTTTTPELTTQQKINAKIKELKKLASIDKQIASMEAKASKLRTEKRRLEREYSL